MVVLTEIANDPGFRWMSLVPSVVTGVIVAIVSATVTVSLALKRFYSEKWWERRWEAYSSIMEALHHIKNHDDHYLIWEERGKSLPDEAKTELTVKLQAAMAEVRKHRDLGSLVISEKAVSCIDVLLQELEEAANCQTWYEYLEMHRDAATKCLLAISSIARRDLKRPQF